MMHRPFVCTKQIYKMSHYTKTRRKEKHIHQPPTRNVLILAISCVCMCVLMKKQQIERITQLMVSYYFVFPVSAFYAEHYNKKISFTAYVWTKSKFLGLSIGVHNIGQGIVTLSEYNEEYIVTFPNGYGR